jgi:hypothetical protein
MVRDFLATVTADALAARHKDPHNSSHEQTTLSCLHVILEEEWEHHRFAVRDLDAIEANADVSRRAATTQATGSPPAGS